MYAKHFRPEIINRINIILDLNKTIEEYESALQIQKHKLIKFVTEIVNNYENYMGKTHPQKIRCYISILIAEIKAYNKYRYTDFTNLYLVASNLLYIIRSNCEDFTFSNTIDKLHDKINVIRDDYTKLDNKLAKKLEEKKLH